jgi:predicted ribosome quality control (RQC) complex YloA/Tae2 family protein
MTFDALTMHAITAEMRARLEGGRIDRALLLDRRRVGLEVFARGARFSVVFDLTPDASRLYLTHERPRRASESVTPFSLLLRKYVASSRVISIEQPRLERLLQIRLSARIDDGLPRTVELIAEVMGRRNNLVLVDEDGSIMDVLARVPPSVNPTRPLLPHLRYTPPRSETKIDPSDSGLARALQHAAATNDGPAWRTVVAQVAGFSPLASREAIARSAGNPEAPASDVAAWEDVAAAINDLAKPLDTGIWQPSLALGGGHTLDFAPYPLTQFAGAEVVTYPNMSEAILAAGQREVAAPAFDRLKRPLLEAISARLDQARRKRSSLERSLASADIADELRAAGEAILANAHTLEPGATALTWEGKRIDLYPTLSAAENAQSYFKRYTDARDAKSSVPPLLAAVAGEIEHLEEMVVHVELAENEKEITAIGRELEHAGILRSSVRRKRLDKRSGEKRSTPTGVHARKPLLGGEILVGGSAAGNDWITFHVAQPEDLWFHARGVPGAHVVLRTPTGAPTQAQILEAARAAAGKSAARDAGTVEVDYTQRKYVRKIRGGAPGLVTYRHERTVAVAPVASHS